MEISTLSNFPRGRKLHETGRETMQEERIQSVRKCIAKGKNYGEMTLKYQVSY